MVTWTLALKDLRLLLRDRRALMVLLAMPLIFILVLGLSLGEGFGQRPDHRLRVSFVDRDRGHADPAAASQSPYADRPWSRAVAGDLLQTAGLRLEDFGADLARAEHEVAAGGRAAVLVFGPRFSQRVDRCSFLKEGINPFFRDGIRVRVREAGIPLHGDPAVDPNDLDFEIIIDPTQRTAASIIEQVAQVCLLRVILPWMIGRDFQAVIAELTGLVRRLGPLARGINVEDRIKQMFSHYDLTGKTWEALTKSSPRPASDASAEAYADESGTGLLRRGAANYQRLVPAYTVMFAFFLVLTTGWLFAGERRQGTLRRLRAAPLTRTQILVGKLLPCLALSAAQGLFLLGAGRLVFGMSWGPQPLWLLPVVLTTSLAAMGLALLVAAVARTETQVAVYGTLLVLVLAGVSGSLMGDRELMPEPMQRLSLLTPHAWALTAYKQLLTTPTPNRAAVLQACGVLTGFGLGFATLAWGLLRLD